MAIELVLSITELSTLTGKTRPTLYKYIKSYEEGMLDEVPYTFIQLFNLMSKPNVRRGEVVNFCKSNFMTVDKDEDVNDIIKLIKDNKDKIDLKKIKDMIEEEINNGGTN